MCGFAGFYGQGENRNEILGEMLETIIHRGPDSEGRYLDEKVALGFRRLSIVDLSEHGNQPMFNEDESLMEKFITIRNFFWSCLRQDIPFILTRIRKFCFMDMRNGEQNW